MRPCCRSRRRSPGLWSWSGSWPSRMAGVQRGRLADRRGLGRGDHDPGQRRGPLAEQPAPALGLLFDRPCRLHADRACGLPGAAGRAATGSGAAWGRCCFTWRRMPRPRSAPLPRWPTWARTGREIEDVEELAGLAWTGGPIRPVLAWAIALFMLSLAGIPPLVGFWGKLAVFASALSVGGLAELRAAVAGGPGGDRRASTPAMAAAYYLRIVGVMFFRPPLGTPPDQARCRRHARGRLGLCGAGRAPGAPPRPVAPRGRTSPPRGTPWHRRPRCASLTYSPRPAALALRPRPAVRGFHSTAIAPLSDPQPDSQQHS